MCKRSLIFIAHRLMKITARWRAIFDDRTDKYPNEIASGVIENIYASSITYLIYKINVRLASPNELCNLRTHLTN